jgi:hypothetical protein
MVTWVSTQQHGCTVFRKRCLRRIEGKLAINYSQKYVFQEHIKLAANFAPRKTFYGINKNYLLRLAYRLAEAYSVSHIFETKSGTTEKINYIFIKQ